MKLAQVELRRIVDSLLLLIRSNTITIISDSLLFPHPEIFH